MDSYLSIYRKDFRWPVVPPVSQKTLHESTVLESQLNACCQETISEKYQKPETQSIQLSSIPSAANQENQPDGFLSQLYDSYPYLYKINKGPSDDTKRNVFRQRFISTYQRDFCTEEDVSKKEKEIAEKREICKKATKEESELGRLHKPQPKLRETNKKKNGGSTDKGGGGFVKKKNQKPGVSEYMDSISKTGSVITQKKLLIRKPK